MKIRKNAKLKKTIEIITCCPPKLIINVFLIRNRIRMILSFW